MGVQIASVSAGLFVISCGDGDQVAAPAAEAGWRVVTARPSGNIVQQWFDSGATVAVRDARRALDEALTTAAVLGSQVSTSGGALIALISRIDVDAIERFYDAGATHYLIEPSTPAELGMTLRFAHRHAERASRSPPGPADRLGRGWDSMPDAAVARSWVETELARGGALGVVLVALTRFDIVNAAYGRAAGDQLLRVAERRVGEIARELSGAVMARTGGSEFLLAVRAEPEQLALAADRLSRSLSRPFAVEGAPAILGSRVGTAAALPGDDSATLLRRAGEALASAKASDGAVQHASGTVGVAPIDALAVDLHRAIERDEVEIMFQPQVAMATDAIVGVEVLARWQHPVLGVLGADLLFAAAERADLGAALSDHIQTLALRQAARWSGELATLRLSINITAGDLARADFAVTFLARVAASGFPIDRLTVEVTETGLIAELDEAAGLLSMLRAAKCRVAIDDFGTGYSSLAYLKGLPLDTLKIDKALAQDITGSARDRVVVRGMIEIAHALELTVIAEGVETVEQRDLLAAEGCDLYQGFLCAEPLDTASLTRLVMAGKDET